MSFKDRFDRLIDYFTEDGDEYDVQEAPAPAHPLGDSPGRLPPRRKRCRIGCHRW